MDVIDDRPDNLPAGAVGDAIYSAAQKYGLDPRVLGGIASIESSFTPGSNYNKPTQYKGLFQIGRNEWNQYGNGGNIYNADDNADAAARMLSDHSQWFKQNYGRDPSPAELYMMHQQGRGFFSNGTMTNIGGNPYPGMRGPQSQASFMSGWGNELDRRMNAPPGTALPYSAESGLNDPALNAINYQTRKRTGNAMADPNTPEGQRALWAQQLGGLGPALQDAGAFLMREPGAATHSAQYMEQAKPQIIDGGTDPLTGQKRLFTLRNGQLAPLGINSSSGLTAGNSAQTGSDQFSAALRRYQNGQASADEVANSADPQVREYAKSLVEGRADPRFMGMRAGAIRPQALMLAQVMDPNFRESDIDARKTMAQSEASSSPQSLGGQKDAASTLIGHISQYREALKELENLGYTGSSSIKNYGTQTAGYYGSDEKVQRVLARMDNLKKGIAGELTKVTRGGNGSLSEVEDWKKGMESYLPISALREGTAAAMDMMFSRMQSQVDRHNAAFHTNKTAEEWLGKSAQASLAKMRAEEAAATSAPSGPLDKARAAIAAGAPRDKVFERLKQNGIDAGGL